jgi:hypothetical protein
MEKKALNNSKFQPVGTYYAGLLGCTKPHIWDMFSRRNSLTVVIDCRRVSRLPKLRAQGDKLQTQMSHDITSFVLVMILHVPIKFPMGSSRCSNSTTLLSHMFWPKLSSFHLYIYTWGQTQRKNLPKNKGRLKVEGTPAYLRWG